MILINFILLFEYFKILKKRYVLLTFVTKTKKPKVEVIGITCFCPDIINTIAVTVYLLKKNKNRQFILGHQGTELIHKCYLVQQREYKLSLSEDVFKIALQETFQHLWKLLFEIII